MAQVLKFGTKLGTVVHNQNFHSVMMFEAELSQCGKGLNSCHVLPACSLVVTCPMTDDVRHSDWVFSIQRIPNFHCVDATNLFETVTFRQGCCRPSSRHRPCFALRAFEVAFYPSDNFPSAAAISQGTTEFSNCWVPQIDVGTQQLSLLCGRWASSSTSASAASSARSSSSAESGSLCAAATKFSSGVTSSSSAVSRNLCVNCWRG